MAEKIIFTDRYCNTYNEVHFVGCISDYTLCGLTLDGDENVAGEYMPTSKKVNCDQCIRIVRYCQNINYKKECKNE